MIEPAHIRRAWRLIRGRAMQTDQIASHFEWKTQYTREVMWQLHRAGKVKPPSRPPGGRPRDPDHTYGAHYYRWACAIPAKLPRDPERWWARHLKKGAYR